MTFLRAALRSAAIVAVCACFYTMLGLSSAALALAHRLAGRPAATGRWRTRVFGTWSRAVGRLLGMRVRVRGRPPAPPFFLVSNHLSYVDVILLAGVVPCVFVAKADVERWPVVGRVCDAVDTLYIRRDSKRDIPRVLGRIESVLSSGRGVALFPEGTSSSGREVLPFRPSVLEVASRSGTPVHVAAVSYRTPAGGPPADRAICWWDETPFATHVWRLLGLPGFDAEIVFGGAPVVEADRKLLAGRLQQAVEREFRTVISG